MGIDVKKYLEVKNPRNPLDLIPRDLLELIVDGFCSYLGAGVSILYPKHNTSNDCTSTSDIVKQFTRFELKGPGAKFSLFCSKYMDFSPQNEYKCKKFDAIKAEEYWSNPTKEAELYQCHMGLLDMTYPLKHHGKVIAVVFSGQMISKTNTDEILKKIQTQECNRTQLKDLLAACESDESIKNAFYHFKRLGEMLQDLIERLYGQKWEAAKLEFLNDVVRELTMMPSDTVEWRKALNGVLESFRSIMGLQNIKVYSRCHSRYELWGNVPNPLETVPSDSNLLSVRYTALLPSSELILLPDVCPEGWHEKDYSELKQSLDFKSKHVMVFSHKNRDKHAPPLDTFIVLTGDVTDEGFIKQFCENVSMRVCYTRLIFTIQEERQKFGTRVSHLGHTAKTPLQRACFYLDDLKKSNRFSKEAEKLINDCSRDIMIARSYITDMQSTPITKGSEKYLRELLDEVVNEISELAHGRQTKIVFDKEEFFNPKVRDQSTLNVLFINLLDNATKYSEPNETVFVRLKSLGKETALIEIENNGQGIPQSHLEKVKKTNERWIPDRLPPYLKKRREGSGIGLTMADQYVEAHGGWLEIESFAEQEKYQNDTIRHWITTVTVALPVIIPQNI